MLTAARELQLSVPGRLHGNPPFERGAPGEEPVRRDRVGQVDDATPTAFTGASCPCTKDTTMNAPTAGDPATPDESWGDVPEADRNTWSRYFLDYLPWFPGPVVMSMLAPRVLEGGTFKQFARPARELYEVGFTPTDYYLLCQDLHIRDARGVLDRERHGHLFREWRSEIVRFFVLEAEEWREWPALVRAGRSPRRATEHVLTGGNPLPMGSLMAASRPGESGFDEMQAVLRALGPLAPGAGEDVIAGGHVVGYTVGD